MKWLIEKSMKWIPKWLVWSLLIGIGICILLFNDFFGSSELFGILAFLYFVFVFFLLVQWILKQIKLVIKLKHEKTKTELLHLKNQVNPHFFFNTLNNLYGLMEKNSKERQMVLKLSDMMRYSIYEGQKDWVTLKDELEYLKNYIELQEIRYHKKSDIKFNYQMGNHDSKIMPLLFIILLENAFKHGLENMEKNAYIHIDFIADKNKVDFVIENNFELQKSENQYSIGLKNLKRRLELVYPNKHTLSFDVDTNTYKAKLSLLLK